MRLIGLLFFGLLLIFPVVVDAQTDTATDSGEVVTTPTRNVIPTKAAVRREGMQGAKDQLKATGTQIRNTMQDARDEARDLFKRTKFEWIIARYQAAINRLNNIVSRLETRIAKMPAGQLVTEAKTHIATAKRHLQTAQTQLDALNNELPAILEGEAALQETEFQTQLRSIKEALFDAHAAIRQAVVVLARAHAANRPTRTITPVSTTSATITIPRPTEGEVLPTQPIEL